MWFVNCVGEQVVHTAEIEPSELSGVAWVPEGVLGLKVKDALSAQSLYHVLARESSKAYKIFRHIQDIATCASLLFAQGASTSTLPSRRCKLLPALV